MSPYQKLKTAFSCFLSNVQETALTDLSILKMPNGELVGVTEDNGVFTVALAEEYSTLESVLVRVASGLPTTAVFPRHRCKVSDKAQFINYITLATDEQED